MLIVLLAWAAYLFLAFSVITHRIQIAGRLIGYDHTRVVHQSTRNGNALLLTA